MIVLEPHTVEVHCRCGNPDDCQMEKYIADVRIASAEVERLRSRLDTIAKLAGAT